MAHDHPAPDRKAVLREAIAACQKVVDRWQRDADELGARHERRTQPAIWFAPEPPNASRC